jgi:hypothetical protein
MQIEQRQSIRVGVAWGLAVGLFFAFLEMIGAAAMGDSPLAPWRAFASVVLGRQALTATPLGTALIVGIIAHFALSAVYGVAYALLSGALPKSTSRSFGQQAVVGLVFGVALYVLNFHVIAPALYPWFQKANQTWQFVLHTIFFGLPLGLAMASSERRMGSGTMMGKLG